MLLLLSFSALLLFCCSPFHGGCHNIGEPQILTGFGVVHAISCRWVWFFSVSRVGCQEFVALKSCAWYNVGCAWFRRLAIIRESYQFCGCGQLRDSDQQDNFVTCGVSAPADEIQLMRTCAYYTRTRRTKLLVACNVLLLRDDGWPPYFLICFGWHWQWHVVNTSSMRARRWHMMRFYAIVCGSNTRRYVVKSIILATCC